MKAKFTRVGKRSLSVILTLMMIVSTMLVGMVTTSAATIPANTTIYLDLSDATGFAGTEVWMSVVATDNQNLHFSNVNTTNAGSYNPSKDTTWVQMELVDGSIYKATVTNASSIGKVSFWNSDYHTYTKLYFCNAIGAVTYDGTNNMFVVNGSPQQNSNRESMCYGGTWTTYIPAAPSTVLDNSEIMFYIKSYDQQYADATFGLTNGNTGDGNTVAGTRTTDKSVAFVKIDKTKLSGDNKFIYISNNIYGCTSNKNPWGGDDYSEIINATGGELYQANDSKSKIDKTTATTKLNDSSDNNISVPVGTDNIILNTSTVSNTKSSFNLDLYVQYYLDDKLVNNNVIAASTSGSEFTLDTSSLDIGQYTLKTVLTDKNIYYIVDTKTITVTQSYKISASDYNSTMGEIKVNDTFLDPSANTITSESSFKVSVTPKTNYQLTALTIGSDTIELTDDQKSSGYTNDAYSISGDITITPTFAAVASSADYYIAGNSNIASQEWTANSIKMTNNGDNTYSYVFNANANTDYIFKVTNGSWASVGGADYGFTSFDSQNSDVTCAFDDNNNKNIKFNLSEASTVEIKFNSSTQKITVNKITKTPLTAPTITIDKTVLDANNTSATITITAGDTYPAGTQYKLYNNDEYQDVTTGITFTVTSAGTYTVRAVPPTGDATYKASPDSISVTVTDSRTPVTIYAKHGTKNKDNYNGNYKLGTTEITTNNVTLTDGAPVSHKVYNGVGGSTVRVQTTMADGIIDRYVHAFVVNGKKTYDATAGVVNNGQNKFYYADITLPTDVDKVEITPIYYYNACQNEGEYIRFYVDAKEMKDSFDWGNTISSYAYYYYNEGTERKQYESDGSWPGQPMLYEEGTERYYALVPKSINGSKVSGLTVNNYGEDEVHNSLLADGDSNKSSKQTYDYDDFRIINEIGYDIVRLDLKPRNVVENSSNKNKLTGIVETGNGSDADATEPKTEIKNDPQKIFTEIAAKDSNRWEPFVDNNNKDVSILGKAVKAGSNVKVYIVSTALYKLSDRGDYMTKWFVFKEITNSENGSTTVEFVTAGCPSDFIPRKLTGDQTEMTDGVNTDAYRTIVNAGCDTAPATIVYEDVKTDRNRIDGRWYYAQSNTEVSAYAYYRLYNETTQQYGDWQQNASYASVNGDVQVTNQQHGLPIQVVSSPLAGYTFSHWSIADSTGKITTDKLNSVGKSFTINLSAEIYYVANFVPAKTGDLVINHGKYVGTGAKGGLGYYGLVVQVKKADSDTWTDVDTGTDVSAGGKTVKITDLAENDQYIRIKLITKTGGLNTFRYWYTTGFNGSEIIGDPDDGAMTVDGTATDDTFGKKGTLTYTFDTEVSKLFAKDSNDKTKQIVTELNFYSDITPTTNKYKLTYKYTDRFGNPKVYIVTGVHTDEYYIQNDNSWAPTDTFIKNNAPYIDDIYKDCKWVIESASKDGADAVLVAKQNDKTYKVTIKPDPDSTEEPLTYFIPLNGYVKNDAKQFFVAPAKNLAGESFKYWSVKESGVEVARHNYLKYTLVVLGNYDITPVYGVEASDSAFISNPQYTREQYTDASGKVVDTVYVDFMLDFVSATNELIRNNPGNYKTGVLIELAQNHKLATDTEGNVTNPDYSGIKFESDDKQLEAAAATTSGTTTKYTYSDNEKRVVYNFEADETRFNNLNRLQYFVPFKNSAANQKYVMKAYFYVIVGGKTVISEQPVYFNFYDIGSQKVA